MSEVNRRFFESLMADKRMSLRSLAQKMGMGHSQLSLTFSGARRAQLDEAAQLSQLLGVSLHDVVEALGVTVRPSNGMRVSVIGVVNGDGTVSLHGTDVVERTTAPEGMTGKVVATQVRAPGTNLGWLDGAVFFMREPTGVEAASLGRFCLVKIKDGPAAMAAVSRGYQDNTHTLRGPFSADSVKLEWATPVLLTRN